MSYKVEKSFKNITEPYVQSWSTLTQKHSFKLIFFYICYTIQMLYVLHDFLSNLFSRVHIERLLVLVL